MVTFLKYLGFLVGVLVVEIILIKLFNYIRIFWECYKIENKIFFGGFRKI